MCVDCEQKEILMEEVKEYKNQTMKQRKDYDSKHAVLKKELTEMERVVLEEEEKVSKEEEDGSVVEFPSHEEKLSKEEEEDDDEEEGSERKAPPAVYEVLHAI